MIKVPSDEEFLTNLILQRTRPYIAAAGKGPLSRWTETGDRSGLLPALSDPAAYVQAALAEVHADVADYVEVIQRARRLVSIGCGNGIADVLLALELGCEAVLLVDVENGLHRHGFGPEGAGYSSLPRAVQLMRENGFTGAIETWNPRRQPEPVFSFDALVSMYALGFHFPAEAYDGFIERNRMRGAIVVHDSRQGRVTR